MYFISNHYTLLDNRFINSDIEVFHRSKKAAARFEPAQLPNLSAQSLPTIVDPD